jgi:hypothetical protein
MIPLMSDVGQLSIANSVEKSMKKTLKNERRNFESNLAKIVLENRQTDL